MIPRLLSFPPPMSPEGKLRWESRNKGLVPRDICFWGYLGTSVSEVLKLATANFGRHELLDSRLRGNDELSKGLIVCKIALLIFFTGISTPSIAAPEDNLDVRQILSDLEKKMQPIQSIQTQFSQTKKLKLFQHEINLQGTLAMEKPSRFAWRTESPVHYSVIFEKNKIMQWDEDTQHVQTVTFSDAPVLKMVIEQMQTWFYGSYVTLLDQYDIHVLSQQPLSLEFIPHEGIVTAAVIQSITIQFRLDEGYIDSLRIKEKTGDESLLTFTGTILNGAIDPQVWSIKNRA